MCVCPVERRIVPFGDFGLLILGLLGDFLLLWAILATIGIAFMFWKMPDLIYGILDELLTERGFPRTRSASKGRPAEGIGGQIVGAIADKFLNQPPQEGSASTGLSAPYNPGR